MSRKLLLAFVGSIYENEPVIESFIKDPRFEFIPISNVVELQDKKPDIMVFSFKGLYDYHSLRKYLALYRWCRKSEAITVLWTGEATVMKPSVHDWSFSTEPTDQRNMSVMALTFKFALMYPDCAEKYGYLNFRNEPKTKFCHFLYSNSYAKERIVFAQKLMQYKKVDCMGEVLNNMPQLPRIQYCEDLPALRDYKFGIAFENRSREHYTTEKIYRCFLTGAVPIYWGDPKVAEQINPASFINCHGFKDFDEVIAHIIEVDNNPELYQAYRNAPPLLPDSPVRRNGREFLHQRIDDIIASVGKIRPRSCSRFYFLRIVMFYVMDGIYLFRQIFSRKLLHPLKKIG